MLVRDHDVSVSMLGMMGRLRRADARTLRQSALADAMGLSVSRASRVVDLLEDRGLVTRTQCPNDGRATNVTLTDAGIVRAASAQHALFLMVSAAFSDRLSPEETATFAQVFGRLLADD
jgi:DNA-binding MarR family transcriptional regulator